MKKYAIIGLCFWMGAWTATAHAATTNAHWLEQLKNPANRVQAQWNVRLEKDPAKIPALVALLHGDDTDLKVTTLQILSETGDASLWKAVVPLLKDKDPVVREAAAHALGALGDPGAIPSLAHSILEGMHFGETLAYWTMPSDITDNYRYACVEALNRIARKEFKYDRSQSNFGRMYWLGQIDRWWKQQQPYHAPSFKSQEAVWQTHQTQIENLIAGLPAQLVQESAGVQEFDTRLKDLKNQVEAIIRAVQSLSIDAGAMKEECSRMAQTLSMIDEIFVYTPELAPWQSAWQELKARLQDSIQSLA